jgi:hypothetical protein
MDRNEDIIDSSRPEYTGALLRHFADLRDGTHGGVSARRDRERLYAEAVALLDPHAGGHSTKSTQSSCSTRAR